VEANGLAIDITNAYIPRQVEAALEYGAMLHVQSKKGIGQFRTPRLKHRPDGRKYVSKDSKAWTEGYVNPSFINPQKSETTVLGVGFRTLFLRIDPKLLKGVVGSFNSEPILEYMGLQAYSGKDCLFRDNGCKFNKGDCSCIWRPNQLLTWGKIQEGNFVPLHENGVIHGGWMNIYDFAKFVKTWMLADDWQIFAGRKSKKQYPHPQDTLESEVAWKLFGNMQTMQRTDFHTANCYGLPLHQFDMAIDSKFVDENTPALRLVLHRRDPTVLTKRDYLNSHKKQQLPKNIEEENTSTVEEDIITEIDIDTSIEVE